MGAYDVYTYGITTTTYTSTWRGRLTDVISAMVTHEHNGAFYLELVAVANANNRFVITRGAVIKVPDGSTGPAGELIDKNFVVDDYIVTIDQRIHVTASHITSRILNIPVVPFVASTTPGPYLKTFLENTVAAGGACTVRHHATFNVGQFNLTIREPRTIRQVLFGKEGSLADSEKAHITVHCEDNGVIRVWTPTTAQNHVVTHDTPVEYAVNMADFSREVDYDAGVYGALPYWADSETGEIAYLTTPVMAAGTSSLFLPRIDVQDMSGRFESKPSAAQLRNAVSGLVSNPTEYIKVKVAYYPEPVYVDDIIPVKFPDFGINEQMTVIKTVYDAIQCKTVSIELGDIKRTLPSTMREIVQKTGIAL